MEILTGVFDFPSFKSSGPQIMTRTFSFRNRVAQASAVLTGYDAEFTRADHNFGRLTVELNTEVRNISGGAEVTVAARYGLRDNSGHWDDLYEGQVRFCLLVEPERLLSTVVLELATDGE